MEIVREASELFTKLDSLSVEERIEAVNKIRLALRDYSPFKAEPVDCVEWVKNTSVKANQYNPNKVASPEMQLLKVSIEEDGYTQPIVTFPHDGHYEVVDGFHRNRVGKEYKVITDRIHGYLPVVAIRKEKQGKSERIASTIRHNRARGKHSIDAMSEIVLELKNRNWKNKRISRELGMDEDEILRLCQISGLEHMFTNEEFSKAWEAGDSTEDFEPLTDILDPEETGDFRTSNTSDPDRIFHTFDKWECHKAGFYASNVEGMTKDQCEAQYAELLTDDGAFRKSLQGVITDWKYSCEHYLTNKSMNRIAWLGQASLAYARGIPSKYRSGFSLLSEKQQIHANEIALEYLNTWLENNGRSPVSYEEGLGGTDRQMEIY